MPRRNPGRPRAALIVSFLALFVAIGSSAAASYVITSESQIKPSVVRQLRQPKVVVRWSVPVTVLHKGATVDDAYATCKPSEHLVGGGGDASGDAGSQKTYLIASNPSAAPSPLPPSGSQTTGLRWHVRFNNQSGPSGNNVIVRAYALCASP